MGCDIHLAVETRGPDGKWTYFREPYFPSMTEHFGGDMPAWYCDGPGIETDTKNAHADGAHLPGCYPVNIDLVPSPYSGRNYILFGILAGVRRYDADYRMISRPKGVPDDASPEVRGWISRYGVDGHSHSFLTLLELLNHDWPLDPSLDEFKVKTLLRLCTLSADRQIKVGDIRLVFFFDN